MTYEFPNVYEILTFSFLLSNNEKKYCDKMLLVVAYFYSYQISVTSNRLTILVRSFYCIALNKVQS